MAEFKITKTGYMSVTNVPDYFIENYMSTANGDYVKIYLYLLYCVKNEKLICVSSLADIFQCTENDIKRALKYWESKQLLSVTETAEGEITSLSLMEGQAPAAAPVTLQASAKEEETTELVPKKHSYSAQQMKEFKKQSDFKLLLFACESYLNKQLTRTELESLLYFYDTLQFSTDLIEYLVQYSVSRNARSFHYMEKVATDWHLKGIKTVEEARANAKPYSKESYQVLKALGVSGHDPNPAEIAFVERWMKEYGFTIEIILEACNRTIERIHQPSFDYTEGILKSWKNAGVHHLSDIEKLAKAHESKTAEKKRQRNEKQPFTTRFHNFEQHSYDFEELEKKLFINQ